jgi:hypothetical protein
MLAEQDDDVGNLGCFRRGEYLPLTLPLDDFPDDAPTVRVYALGTLLATFKAPLADRPAILFGMPYFLGPDFDDGVYVLIASWAISAVADAAVMLFQVRGGRGLAPIAAVIEQTRPLGQAVVSFDDEGLGSMGYNPRPER